jgi:pimeloyl-ACP methyl ester carboxylesterase
MITKNKNGENHLTRITIRRKFSLALALWLLLFWSLFPVFSFGFDAKYFPAPNPPKIGREQIQPPLSDAHSSEEIPTTEWIFHKTSDNTHPDGNEQQAVWLMNRARSNPAQEGLWLAASDDEDVASGRTHFGVDLNLLKSEFSGYNAMPPAAFDVRLYNAAREHSEDLIARDTQDHEGQIELIKDAGFSYIEARANVFAYSYSSLNAHAAWNIDWGRDTSDGMQESRGHRKAVMSLDGDYTNAGIAMVSDADPDTEVGPLVSSGNYCKADTSKENHHNRFLVGTVWNDSNGNSMYDPGEGIRGVTVMPDHGRYYAVTSNSGGYAIPVTSPGTYKVTFSGSSINGVKTATVEGKSVLLDFMPDFDMPLTYTLTAFVTGGNGIIMPDRIEVNEGAEQIFIITPADGYRIADFTDNGKDKISELINNEYRLTDIRQNHQLVVRFEGKLYLPIPPDNVSATDGGTYADKITITWDALEGTNSYYRVWRNTVNNPDTAQPIGYWQTATVYDDTAIESDRIYYYWVKSAPDISGDKAGPYSKYDNGSAKTKQKDRTVVKGDINADNTTDLMDVIVALKVLSGETAPRLRSDYTSSGADTDNSAWDAVVPAENNNKDKVGFSEIFYIFQVAAGLVPQSGFLEMSDDVRIYYEISGEGTPLVLIHGGEDDNYGQLKGSSSWDPQMQAFNKQFKVIRYDIRGFSRSDAVQNHPLYYWGWGEKEDRTTADLAELLKYLNIQKAHICGLSIGSGIAAQLAVFHPEMVDKLILASPWFDHTFACSEQQREKLDSFSDRTLLLLGDGDIWSWNEWYDACYEGYCREGVFITNAGHFCNADQPEQFSSYVSEFLNSESKSFFSRKQNLLKP